MPVDTAVDAHSQRGTNCAQAVLRGFQHVLHVPAERIDEAIAHGGGRAPEGLCGALHSALQLVEPTDHDDLRAAFQAEAGALACRDVRSLGKLSCRDCVRVAAELVLRRIVGR